jgi:hypothetical protein
MHRNLMELPEKRKTARRIIVKLIFENVMKLCEAT